MPLFSIEQTYTKELYHEYAWCAYDKQIESAWNSNKAIQNRHFRVDFYDDYFQTISDNLIGFSVLCFSPISRAIS